MLTNLHLLYILQIICWDRKKQVMLDPTFQTSSLQLANPTTHRAGETYCSSISVLIGSFACNWGTVERFPRVQNEKAPVALSFLLFPSFLTSFVFSLPSIPAVKHASPLTVDWGSESSTSCQAGQSLSTQDKPAFDYPGGQLPQRQIANIPLEQSLPSVLMLASTIFSASSSFCFPPQL